MRVESGGGGEPLGADDAMVCVSGRVGAGEYVGARWGGRIGHLGRGWIDYPDDANGPDNSVGCDGHWFDLAGVTEAMSRGLYGVCQRVYDPKLCLAIRQPSGRSANFLGEGSVRQVQEIGLPKAKCRPGGIWCL